ncbi:MAG: hypothetical protein HYT63_01360 [Candidatus Yanofskybacteria bacterium]|nr:hypothetical protein [Candidatus Yanofskybacteria bacterium]
MPNKKLYSAAAVLVGGIIGVGIFGVPFVFSKAGFLTGLLFLIGLSAVTLILNLAYGEIILRTDKAHQLVGYADVYLGKFFKKLTFFTFVLGIYSALLAYIIVGGEFLANILSFKFFVSADSLSVFFFFLVAFVLLGGLKTVSAVDLFMAFLYVASISLIVFWGAGHVNFQNFTLWNKDFWFLPYGVILFALSGMSSVALQREVLDGQEFNLKKSIILGSLIPPVIYLIFAFLVVGVSGEVTSPEAFAGLSSFLGSKVVLAGSIFGVLAIFTSFLNLGRVLQESFQFDFRLGKFTAWFLALWPPFFLFIFGIRNFINVIGLAGSVAIGLQSVVFVLIYSKVKRMGHRIPEYSLNMPIWFWYLVIAVFASGVLLAFI